MVGRCIPRHFLDLNLNLDFSAKIVRFTCRKNLHVPKLHTCRRIVAFLETHLEGRGCELGAKSTIVSFIVFSTLVSLRVHQVYISIIRMNDFRGILKIAKTKKQVM